MIKFPSFNPRELKAILFLLSALLIGGLITLYQSKNPSFAPELVIGDLVDSVSGYDSTNKRSSLKDKININYATEKELEFLPGIGPFLSKRIIEYRQKNGKFKKIEELKRIKGIGEKKFKLIKDYIKID